MRGRILPSLKFDEPRKDIIESQMILNSIPPEKKSINSIQLHRDMQKVVEEGITQQFWRYLKKEYPEKIIVNDFFNGDKGSYKLFERSLKDEKLELELIADNRHPFLINKEDAKILHSRESGSYKQVMLTDKNALGTTCYSGEVNLIKSNVLRRFSVKSLIAYMFEEYNVIIPIHESMKMIKPINKQLDDLAKSQFTVGEDMITMYTRQIIQKYSKEHNLSREETNLLMERAKKNSIAVSKKIGRHIASMIINLGTPKEEKEKKKMLSIFNEIFITPFIETGGILENKVSRKR